MDDATKDLILTVATMAEDARKNYASRKCVTTNDPGWSSCVTIRVPVAMLNRIRELAEQAGVEVPR